MFAPVNRNPSLKELKSFGWIMLGGLGGIALVLLLAALSGGSESGERAIPAIVWVLGLAGPTVWLVSRLSPAATRVLYVGWMTATRPIGIVVFVVLMSVLFGLFVPVFSLIVRRADPLRLRRQSKASYWEDVAPQKPSLRHMARLS